MSRAHTMGRQSGESGLLDSSATLLSGGGPSRIRVSNHNIALRELDFEPPINVSANLFSGSSEVIPLSGQIGSSVKNSKRQLGGRSRQTE
jgi:hypothetical protein